MINNKRKTDQYFSFGPATYDDILKKTTNNLDTTKASQQSDIPTKTQKTEFGLLRRKLLWKYQSVYFEINVPIRFKTN